MRFARVTVPLALALLACQPSPRIRAQQIPEFPKTLPSDSASTDDLEDSGATKQLKRQIADLFDHGNYAQIDSITDKIRVEKTRLVGGGWLITRVYQALEAKEGTTPEQHMAQLSAWIGERPQSITPRVALARAYIRAAWAARGGGPGGRQLFSERIAEAKNVLDSSANLSPMCPDWFFQMQTVALAQGWDKGRTTELFQRATRFEPDYLYYYQSYARYLLPKWDGKNGDDVAFAKTIADTIGGSKGDFIYYQIGIVVLGVCNCTVRENPLDWPRLQRGYRSQHEMFANTNYDTNQLALLAWRFNDRDAAREAFDQIGSRWVDRVWKSHARFTQVRRWAYGSSVAH
jgi:hypothetical protein